MLFTSPASGFNVVAYWCFCVFIRTHYFYFLLTCTSRKSRNVRLVSLPCKPSVMVLLLWFTGLISCCILQKAEHYRTPGHFSIHHEDVFHIKCNPTAWLKLLFLWRFTCRVKLINLVQLCEVCFPKPTAWAVCYFFQQPVDQRTLSVPLRIKAHATKRLKFSLYHLSPLKFLAFFCFVLKPQRDHKALGSLMSPCQHFTPLKQIIPLAGLKQPNHIRWTPHSCRINT